MKPQDKMVRPLKNKRGIALIMSVGILAIMSIIATSFAVNMRMEQEAALNYLRSVKALYFAEAGVNKAIADIRSQVKSKKYDDIISYVNSYATQEQTIDDTSTYAVTIGKENTKVNINALDETDYVWIDTLASKGLSYTDIAKIIDYRDSDSTAISQLCTSIAPQSASGDETNAKNAPYVSLEEVKLAIGDTKYESIKDDITIFAPIIRGGLVGKYFVNITGFSSSTILDLSNYEGKVIELGKFKSIILPGSDSGSGDPGDEKGRAESNDAYFAGTYLVNDLVGFGLDKFGVKWEGFIYIPSNKVDSSINFSANSDDGIRLYIDEIEILSDWRDRSLGDAAATGSYSVKSAGWHPIKIEYYENQYRNEVDLKWDVFGSLDFISAEYFGYYPPSYLGAYPSTTATETTYNSAGCYKITSTGKTKTKDGTIVAEKKVTTGVKVFGTWTQTTRAEFYAPWFSVYNDYSDGEILNVTWFDSCPTDAAETTTEPNALKLGFWDNFDEDVGYTVVNLVGDDYTHWGYFDNWDGANNDNEFSLEAETLGTVIVAEINAYYYYMDSRTSYDLFAKAWEMDANTPSERRATAWDVAWFYPKHVSSFQGVSGFLGENNTRDYYNSQKQDYTPYYASNKGISELTLNTSYDGGPETGGHSFQKDWSPYLQSKILGVQGIGTHYKAYINGNFTTNEGDDERTSTNAACVALRPYNSDKIEWPSGSGTYLDLIIETFTTYWDDIKIVPGKGFFVSTSFYDNLDVEWGYVSWNESAPSGTTISIEGRTTNPTTDTDWSSISNGQALNLSKAKWFQYKVTMTDTTLLGATPVLKDVTVTYLPNVEVFYWRTETK